MTYELRSANCERSGQKCVIEFSKLAFNGLVEVWRTTSI